MKKQYLRRLAVCCIVGATVIMTVACGEETETANVLNMPKIASGSEIDRNINGAYEGYTNKIYGLKSDGKFKLSFKTAIPLPDNAIEVYDENGNKVDILRYDTLNEDGQTVEISALNGNYGRWSEYKMYIYYDIDSADLVELEEPLVVQFNTVSKVEVPVLNAGIDDKCNFKLYWNKVDGADGYKIYKYSNDSSRVVLVTDVDSDVTEWNDWDNSQVGNDTLNSVVLSQNDGLNADDIYFITAYNDNGESSNSNSINVKDYAGVIITKVKDNKQLDPGEYINDTKDLPRTVDVETLNGNTIKCSIDYELDEHTRYSDNIYYGYVINGTELKGYTEVKVKNTVSLPSKVLNGVEIYRDCNHIEFEVVHAKTDGISEVDLRDWIESNEKVKEAVGNKDGVVYKGSRSRALEYIKNELYSGKSEIDLNNYGYVQSLEGLTDVVTDISYNSFVPSIKSVKLDESTNKVYIEYVDNDANDSERYNVLNNKISNICKELLKNNKVVDESTIYEYISSNYTYSKGNSIYSMLHDGKGSAVAHAKLFEILARNLVTEDVYTVDGYLNGVEHTWNIMKKDNEYVYIDCTNNTNNIGITKICFDMSVDTAEKYGYVKKNNIIDVGSSSDDKYEYYNKNKLEASNYDEYIKLVSDELKSGANPICIRYTGNEIKSSDIVSGISGVFKDAGKEKLLGKLHFGDGLGYYVLWYDKAVVKSNENIETEQNEESLSNNEGQVESQDS